jgi:glycerol kinase
MPGGATVIVWFYLRSPELADEFERRDVVLGSIDTVSAWRLTRPLDVPGQPSEPADYVLISEISGVDRWEEQISEQVQRLTDDYAQFVSAREMLVLERIL